MSCHAEIGDIQVPLPLLNRIYFRDKRNLNIIIYAGIKVKGMLILNADLKD